MIAALRDFIVSYIPKHKQSRKRRVYVDSMNQVPRLHGGRVSISSLLSPLRIINTSKNCHPGTVAICACIYTILKADH